MITLRLVRVALLLLIATILPRELSAHEATLGVLEFREVRPGAFVGRWTMGPSIGAARGGPGGAAALFPAAAGDELRREGIGRSDHNHQSRCRYVGGADQDHSDR